MDSLHFNKIRILILLSDYFVLQCVYNSVFYFRFMLIECKIHVLGSALANNSMYIEYFVNTDG